MRFNFTYLLLILFCYISCGLENTSADDPNFNMIEIDSSIKNNGFIDSIVFPYKNELEDEMSQIIGVASKTLSNEVKRGETTLGNFVSDLIYYQSNLLFKDSIHLALINTHGGLRVPISEGNISVRNIFELMPFDNEMVVLTLTGKEVERVFQHTAQDCRNSISPAIFTIYDGAAKNIRINNQPIDTNKTYNLAISDYLANGGGGFDFLIEKPQKSINIKLRDMIIKHIKELTSNEKQVSAELENRITFTRNVQ